MIKSRVQHERQGAERAAVNAPIQGTSADIIKRAMVRMCPALEREGLGAVRMLMQVHDELVFEVPESDVEQRRRGHPPRHGAGGRAGRHPERAARGRYRHRAELGRRALSSAPPGAGEDIAALAKGGRTNFFGFLIRLAARLPFLFIAGRLYGPEALGAFAYAVIVMEFAAQLSTLGLKRGLAQQLSTTDQPHSCVVTDAILAAFIASAVSTLILMLFPQAMFPAGDIHGADWLLPMVIFGIAGADIALAALAYRHNIGATVARPRASSSRGRSASPPASAC